MIDDDEDALLESGKQGRHWSFEAACRILPDVRRLTEVARDRYQPLQQTRTGQPAESAERSEAEQAMRMCLARWVREMEALGATVTGLWRVEFESEEGAYPWAWPEETLRSFRGEDEGEETAIH